MGQHLLSHCYIKLQHLKRANLRLRLDAAAASPRMSLCQDRSSKPLTSVSGRALPFSGTVPRQPGFVSPPSACLGWVQLSARLGLEMTSQLFTSERLGLCHWKPRLPLSPSLSLALEPFLFPQQSAEVSKPVLETCWVLNPWFPYFTKHSILFSNLLI